MTRQTEQVILDKVLYHDYSIFNKWLKRHENRSFMLTMQFESFSLLNMWNVHVRFDLANIVICLTLIAFVVSHPDGAPTSACSTSTPSHGAYQSGDNTRNPFKLQIGSNNNITEGQNLTVILRAKNESNPVQFKGFMISVRYENDSSLVSGVFTNLGYANYCKTIFHQ